ncbi:MAG TPA: ABC transporter substrate-binding protein [Trebonia sp.]|jgi:NitT/TauT family transport system substrate-binding protein
MPIAATAAIAVLAGCSAGTAGSGGGHLEKTSIVVDAFPAIDSAGLFIAEQRGLFKQQGLNVTIDLASTSQTAVDGQLAGKYDITSADYVTYVDNALLKKAPLRIIDESSFLQPNVLTLLVKGGSSVQRVSQLKDKTVSVNAPDDIGTLLVDSLLSDDGVSLSSVKFNNNVGFPDVVKNLSDGKVDAAFSPEPFVSLDGMQAGTEVLADLDQGGSSGFPIQGIAVTQSWARDNPNTLAAFERAYAQGQELADTDRAAVEAALEKFLGLPALAASLVSLPGFPTGVDSVRLQRLVDAMVRFGLLSKQYSTFKISSIIDNG